MPSTHVDDIIIIGDIVNLLIIYIESLLQVINDNNKRYLRTKYKC